MEGKLFLCTILPNALANGKVYCAVRQEMDITFSDEESLVEEQLFTAPVTVVLLLVRVSDGTRIGYVRKQMRFARRLKLEQEYVLVRNFNECDRCAGTGIYTGPSGYVRTKLGEKQRLCFTCGGTGIVSFH